MKNIDEINEVIQRAKQDRADHIASAVRAYVLPLALVAGVSLMLLQFSAKPPVQPSEDARVAQVTSADR